MPYANQKDADQPAHPLSLITLISVFVIRSLDCIIPINAMGQGPIIVNFIQFSRNIVAKSYNRQLLKLGQKCKYAKYFYETLYTKSQVLYPSIVMIIIQIFSKTPCAKREVLRNEKCTWSQRDCICSTFYFTNHLLTVSLKRKTNNILHNHTTFDCRKGSKSHWYTTARCWFMTCPVFPKMLTYPGLLLINVAVYDKLN